MDIKEIKKIVLEKYKGKKRKQGTPAIFHPLGVAQILKEKGFSIDYQIAGLLHDMVEDMGVTRQEILNWSNEKIAEAVNLVTKEDNYDEQEYHDRIMKNKMAKMVKLADRLYNVRDAKNTNCIEFQRKYIKETEDWYLSMAKGTCFEDELNRALKELKNCVNKKEIKRIVEMRKQGEKVGIKDCDFER